jgi:hypothetical protein
MAFGIEIWNLVESLAVSFVAMIPPIDRRIVRQRRGRRGMETGTADPESSLQQSA